MPSSCVGDPIAFLCVIKEIKPVIRLDRDSGRKVVMGVTANWVGCKYQTPSDLLDGFKAEQIRCLQRALYPQKIVASLKSQDLTLMVSVITVQPTRK